MKGMESSFSSPGEGSRRAGRTTSQRDANAGEQQGLAKYAHVSTYGSCKCYGAHGARIYTGPGVQGAHW